jgi:protein-L-isoaspartate(D-aspartate) O-methyltransferase
MNDSDRERMLRIDIEGRGIEDRSVLAALTRVPRDRFVPPSLEHRAWDDRPLPIGHDQTISQPYIVAVMTEALDVKPGMKVLEIGTGSGYQTAILAELGAEVHSLEVVPALANAAIERLDSLGYTNITVCIGDGYSGLPDQAPFDRILVTAAPREIPMGLWGQLKDGGIMVLPVGDEDQELIVLQKTESGLQQRTLFPVRFVPMVRSGGSREPGSGSQGPVGG